MRPGAVALALLVTLSLPVVVAGEPRVGYYRQPALRADTLVFVAEGDLWKVGAGGGLASRLTSHPGVEELPSISPDGEWLAFTAGYEGPAEAYVMPLDGGLPKRLTWSGGPARVAGWTPDGRVMVSSRNEAGLPDWRMTLIDPRSGDSSDVPLAQAASGAYDASGRTLVFTRVAFQGSHAKRYKGGTAQSLWSWTEGAAEAVPLTADHPGTSKDPSWWGDRIVFASDRDGTMNVWSMRADGSDLRQHTHHDGWDVAGPSCSGGPGEFKIGCGDLRLVGTGEKVAYQLGADLRMLDLATGEDRPIPITIESDFDQTRQQWIEKPLDYVSSAHLSPDGDRIVLTARGQVLVAPRRQGRLVEATHQPGVRHRDARFMPDGKSLVVLSDASGEVEVWTTPANGVGDARQLTSDGKVLRWEAVPSPDGKWIAHRDKDQQLWLLEVATKKHRLVEHSTIDAPTDLRWSPDSRWLAYVSWADNAFSVIKLHELSTKATTTITSDRFDSSSPAWSPDGDWLYFLSERHLESLVDSPWGAHQPEPFFDRKAQIFQLALERGLRSPFAPENELQGDEEEDDEKEEDAEDEKDDDDDAKKPPKVVIDLDGIASRLIEVPLPAGNMSALFVGDERLYWLATDTTAERKAQLMAAPVARRDVEAEVLVPDVQGYELSQDASALLVRKKDALHVIDADAEAPADLEKTAVDLSAWKLAIVPRDEWRQMFMEAWRLHRDYFYDKAMHGVDWRAMREKYRPLVDRVTTRAELSDVIAQMISELSALHASVRGGDLRKGEDDVQPGLLGARITRDASAGGHRVEHVHRSDPDRPELRAPLAQPDVDVHDGDVILLVDGVATSDVPDVGALLRGKAGRQVLLRVKPSGKNAAARDVIVVPLDAAKARDLRYHEWELTRRERVEEVGGGQIGYVHLRAMGSGDIADWARGYYPVFTRQGLVVDVRHNGGGNIDSWILGRLLRRAWFYWSQREGRTPTWNMQQAFRGHLVVLCDQNTGSDGEAFTEGFRRLGLGPIVGTRTWGGEIWLSGGNVLVDQGIATAAEYGVFGPEGEWLIEGWGVEPDVVVDNLPHATYLGEDAQLDAAIARLKERIAAEPVAIPPVPQHPDKSFRNAPSK